MSELRVPESFKNVYLSIKDCPMSPQMNQTLRKLIYSRSHMQTQTKISSVETSVAKELTLVILLL